MKSTLLALAAALALPPAGETQTVAEPAGYRMDEYRAPVPGSIAGGTVIGPERAFELWKAGAAGFIDVMPQAPRPANLPEGTIWRDKPRESIPGAIWMPNVGYGAIADVTAEYFRAGLDVATRGDPAGPVPGSIAGGTVIGPERAFELWKAGVAGFIDVMPQAPRPANLPEGTIWRDKPRESIPGAIWIPNVGYGAIADVTAEYFRAGLDVATRGDPAGPVVIFCLEDCWMSWNAAKRAIDWGYRDVHWFPEGTDGWQLWGYPLERVEPLPGQPTTGG